VVSTASSVAFTGGRWVFTDFSVAFTGGRWFIWTSPPRLPLFAITPPPPFAIPQRTVAITHPQFATAQPPLCDYPSLSAGRWLLRTFLSRYRPAGGLYGPPHRAIGRRGCFYGLFYRVFGRRVVFMHFSIAPSAGVWILRTCLWPAGAKNDRGRHAKSTFLSEVRNPSPEPRFLPPGT
jgi:hypothetical protein